MSNPLARMLTSVVKSSAKSLMSQGIKSTAKGLIKQYMAKTPEQIETEIKNQLGYLTSHYKLDKEQRISFKSSSVFMQEWLTHSPLVAGKLFRDEEDGQVIHNNEPLTNSGKVAILHQFIKATNAQSSAISGHFDAAIKLLDAVDYNGMKFKREMTGWNPSNTSVIDTWMERCFGSALVSDPTYTRMVFRRWIIGAANRIINPGCSLDGCLILMGAPGIGKTQFLRQIMPSPFDTRTGEVYCDLKNANRFVEGMIGKSIVNFDELSILDYPKTTEIFKQLLTTQYWDVRLAWRRNVQRFRARAAFGGTTNKTQIIPDANLSRRLWVIELSDAQRLDFDFMNANKKALFQEAVYLAQNGGSCILTPEEQIQVETINRKYMINH